MQRSVDGQSRLIWVIVIDSRVPVCREVVRNFFFFQVWLCQAKPSCIVVLLYKRTLYEQSPTHTRVELTLSETEGHQGRVESLVICDDKLFSG
jgi:hypothetical protein